MSTSQTIRNNAAYHAGLLVSITELEYVPSAQAQQAAYFKDLEYQFRGSERKLKKSSGTTAKLQKRHRDLHDSTARRLAHKLIGRGEEFSEREGEEERKYLEALEQELMQKENHIFLCNIISEAKDVSADLSSKAKKYDSLKEELGGLYRVVFDGPTHDFPEDDNLEREVRSTQIHYDEIQQKLNSESQAAGILARADGIMGACENKLKEALRFSTWDMWGGGRISDILERNALMAAQSLAIQAQMLIQQVLSISSDVQDIGALDAIQVAHGSVVKDIIFDNPFWDYAFHKKIQASFTAIKNAHGRLKDELHSASVRVDAKGLHLIEAAQTLENRRNALHSFRRDVFERVTGP